MDRIALGPTQQLHEHLIALWKDDPESLLAGCAEANRRLAARGIKFEQAENMAVTLSALVLDPAAVTTLTRITETLHQIVEQALHWVLGSRERLDRYFADHRRVFPYLCKTRGLDSWQGYSRYDAVITSTGHIKIIELNTGCPAGFLHAEDFSQVTRDTLCSIDPAWKAPAAFGTIAPEVLVEELLAIESRAQVPRGMVALVNDENRLVHELDLLATALGRRGREAAIVPAEEFRCHDGLLTWGGRPVSLTFNKVRVSTPNSPSCHWQAGFEERYAGLLAGMRDGAATSVNNLCAMTIGEDKSLLALLREPEFHSQLSPDQREFVAEHVPWTVRLQQGCVGWRDETVDLLPYVQRNREHLVIKPANEGRGFGVLVGKYCTPGRWRQACRVHEGLPCVVQEFFQPATLPVVRPGGEGGRIASMFLTVGLAVIGGAYRGLLSRVSSGAVTNVGRGGMVQAVFLKGPGARD